MSKVKEEINLFTIDQPTRTGVKASAGSGKTFGLTGSYLRCFLEGVPPEHLLTATFTRKAAGEILSRVLKRLANACVSEQAATNLARELQLTYFNQNEAVLQLERLCRSMHRVSISTLDSFFNRVLRAFAVELGHSSDMQLSDESQPEAVRLQTQAIAEMMASGHVLPLDKLMDTLQDNKAESQISASLLKKMADAHDIYMSAPETAWVMPKDVGVKLSKSELEAAVQQLSSIADSLPPGRLVKSIKSDVEKINSEQWEEILNSGPCKNLLDGKTQFYNKEIPEHLVSAYMPLLNHAAASVVESFNHKTEALLNLLRIYHANYLHFQQADRLLFFRDVPRLLSEVLPENLRDESGYRLDINVDHLLIDEFQDTDPSQYAILQWFMKRICQLPSNQGLIYCVGDLKQSIYGWRGATPEIFERLGGDIQTLSWMENNTSYRSSQVVLDLVNRFFSSVSQEPTLVEKSRTAAESWRRMFINHRAAKMLSGYVKIETVFSVTNEDEESTEQSGDFEENAPDDKSEMRTIRPSEIAAKIQEIIQNAPLATVGILMRSNVGVSRLIFELRELGIDASAEGKSDITDDPAVMLILSAIKLADHPGDTASCFHLLNSPLAEMLALKSIRDASRISSTIRFQLSSHGFANTLLPWAKKLAEQGDQSTALRMEQLIILADSFDTTEVRRCKDFISLVSSKKMENPSLSRVRVMTIHGAKGLEFDITILPELSGEIARPDNIVVSRDPDTLIIDRVSRYPNKLIAQLCPELEEIRQKQADRDIREALCLLYVGMTRARRALHILLRPTAETSTRLTHAYLLRQVLNLEMHDVYEAGNSDWYREFQVLQELSAPTEPETQSPTVDVTGWYHKLLSKTSASNRAQQFPVGVATLLDTERRGLALRRGSAVHAMLCGVEWSSMPLPTSEQLKLMVRRELPDALDDEIKQCIQIFYTAMQNSTLQKSLAMPDISEGERVELWREHRFLELVDGRMLQGIFDRVLVVYSGTTPIKATLLDFKTDDVRSYAQAKHSASRYNNQIETYRQALMQMLKLPGSSVNASLFFTANGVEIEMPVH